MNTRLIFLSYLSTKMASRASQVKFRFSTAASPIRPHQQLITTNLSPSELSKSTKKRKTRKLIHLSFISECLILSRKSTQLQLSSPLTKFRITRSKDINYMKNTRNYLRKFATVMSSTMFT